jgi:hypothetical protein
MPTVNAATHLAFTCNMSNRKKVRQARLENKMYKPRRPLICKPTFSAAKNTRVANMYKFHLAALLHSVKCYVAFPAEAWS